MMFAMCCSSPYNYAIDTATEENLYSQTDGGQCITTMLVADD
jgi:hypothetical protein